MKGRIVTVAIVFVMSTLAITPNAGESAAQPGASQAGKAHQAVSMTLRTQSAPTPGDDLKNSPIMFVENAGQWDEDARFQALGGPAGTLWLAEDAIWITVAEEGGSEVRGSEVRGSENQWADRSMERLPDLRPATSGAPRRGANIKLSFVGANLHPQIEPFERLATRVSYFIGNNPDQWRPEVPVWRGARYVDLYPGVDLELTSEAGQMVSRLAARPGADLDAVRLHIEGADAVAEAGDALRLSTAAGEFTLPLLRMDGWLGTGSQVAPSGAQAFDVAAPFAPANSNRPSAIENRRSPADNPADLLYSTFLGGSDYDTGNAVAVDGAGSAYVMGTTYSLDFPTTPGAFDPSYNGEYEAFVVKLNPTGSGLVYATFLGGSNYDLGTAIAVDSAGSAYVTGVTYPLDFPTTPGAFDTSHNGYADAFMVKLNPAGSGLAYSTFLGGNDYDAGLAIAVDGAGNAYVTGWTYSGDFPTTPGAFDPSHNAYTDVFVVKLNPAGSELAYATFLGGGSMEDGNAIAVDGAGSAYVTGSTGSSDFPTTPGAFDPSLNILDAFVVKLNPAGSGLAYATFLGGNDTDQGYGIAVDGAGSAYVTGYTNSSDFPTTPGAFDPSHNAYTDAFVVKLNPAGSGLAYATFLGGGSMDEGHAIAVDGAGSAHVRGRTDSSGFPTTLGAFDTSHNGNLDAFVIKLNPTGSELAYGTFLGGSDSDYGYGIVVDGVGSTYVTGYTFSSNFPTTPGAFDTSFSGGDGFVVKLAMGSESDLSISHIEVTQATQEDRNRVPLIAGKATYVRVYVDCGEGCISLPDVTGVLRGFGPSGQLPGSPLAPIGNPITAFHEDWRNQRGNMGKTLNFKLPSAWLTDIVTLTAEVNGASRSEAVTFQPVQSLKVVYVPIRYGSQSPDATRISTGSGWASQVFPTAKIDYVPGPTLQWYRCLKQGPQCSRAYSNTRSLFNELTTQYRLVNAYVYGWLPDGTLDGGISDPTWYGGAGKAAIGDDLPTEGPRVFAHEIAHLLGRRHANSSSCSPDLIDPDSDWAYDNSLIKDYGLNGRVLSWWLSSSTAVKDPTTTYDYMSYCGWLDDNNVWTSDWTYTHLYWEMVRNQAATTQNRSLSTPQSYFIASGLIYTDDTAILDPAWVITSTVIPENPPAGTQYCLEAQDASGMALASHCFDLTFMNYETGEATDVDGFNLMLPYPDGVARIVLKKGADELAVQPVSANPPVVTVLSPNGGETWSATGAYTVTWTASDTDGDPLTYSVLYSPDGSDWMPVGTTITQTHLAVNAAELVGSTNARIRVQATDGVNTSRDESDAAFTVGRKAPEAFITSPEADSATLANTPVWLEGYAYDLEDGALADAALNWSSSRDGELGTGAELLTALSLGQHTLTFTAIDGDANTATATVEVLATFAEDVVPDCQADTFDIQAIASRWQQRVGDSGWDSRFDLDGDGTITVADIMHVAAAWGTTCS